MLLLPPFVTDCKDRASLEVKKLLLGRVDYLNLDIVHSRGQLALKVRRII